MFFKARWNSLSRIVSGSPLQGAETVAVQPKKAAGLFLFLLPLLIILGTIDTLTNGRTRNWPVADD